MKLLFRNNEKGLAAIKDGKWYFPDKRSDIDCEGVWDCEVSKDKEKYAFVTGHKVNVPDYRLAKDHIVNLLLLERKKEWYSYYVKVARMGEDDLFFESDENRIRIGYYAGDDFVEVASYGLHHHNMRQFYKIDHTLKGWDKFYKEVFLESLSFLDDPLKIVAAAIGYNRGFAFSSQITEINIYGNKVIEITTDGFSAYECTRVYGYDTEMCDVFTVDISADTYKCLKKESVDLKSLRDWMSAHHVSLKSGTAEKGLIRREIFCMGCDFDVLCVDSFGLLKTIDTLTEEQKNEIESSFANLHDFRAKVAKNISSKNIGEFRKISDVNILGLEMLSR